MAIYKGTIKFVGGGEDKSETERERESMNKQTDKNQNLSAKRKYTQDVPLGVPLSEPDTSATCQATLRHFINCNPTLKL